MLQITIYNHAYSILILNSSLLSMRYQRRDSIKRRNASGGVGCDGTIRGGLEWKTPSCSTVSCPTPAVGFGFINRGLKTGVKLGDPGPQGLQGNLNPF